MSADATGHVYRHAPFDGSTLLVLLAIADTVSDQNDNEFWMSYPKLATKCRVHRDTVRKAVLELADAGWVEVVYRSAGKHPSRYRFVFDDQRDVVFEARSRTRGTSAGTGSATPRHPRGVPADLTGGTRARSAGLNNPTEPKRTRVRDVAADRAAQRRLGLACTTCQGSHHVLTDDPVPTTVPCPDCSGCSTGPAR